MAIFNLKESTSGPIFQTKSTNRHTQPIWSVRWLDYDEEGRYRFCSISTDGQVILSCNLRSELIIIYQGQNVDPGEKRASRGPTSRAQF